MVLRPVRCLLPAPNMRLYALQTLALCEREANRSHILSHGAASPTAYPQKSGVIRAPRLLCGARPVFYRYASLLTNRVGGSTDG